MTPNTPARDAAVSDETVAELRALVPDLVAFIEVSEAEYTSDLTEADGDEEGSQWREEDDEAVSHVLADDGHTLIPGAITFGHIRRARAAVNALPATLARMDQDAATIAGLRGVLEAYVTLGAEVAGTCLGLAMSTYHPAPDEALMGLFEKSQALAPIARAALSDPRS